MQKNTHRNKNQKKKSYSIFTQLDGTSPDGCINYTVTSQVLGLPHWKVAPNNVVLLANFTEAKSGAIETSNSRTVVVHQPLKLEFSPHTPKHFKPGLPYHGKLRVLRPDAKTPAVAEKIQLCLRIRRKDEWQRSVVECKNFSSPNLQGYLDFIVPPQHKSIVLLSFVATAVDYPTKYYSPDKRWRVLKKKKKFINSKYKNNKSLYYYIYSGICRPAISIHRRRAMVFTNFELPIIDTWLSATRL